MRLIGRMQQFRRYSQSYPRQIWVLVAGSFVNSLGSGLVFPFLTLYLRQKLGISLAQIGLVFTLNAVTSVISGVAGGIIADRLGRRIAMLVSLLTSGMVMFLMGIASTFGQMIVLAAGIGLTSALFQPARDAMIADLIEPERRTETYSILRVATNLGFAIGPAIGGFLAAVSYLLSFGLAAAASVTFFVLTLLFVKETRPEAAERGSTRVPMSGYGPVLRDHAYLVFIGLFVLTNAAYSQITTNLPVYMKEFFGLGEQYFGWVMTTNATMVVVLQMWVTRRTSHWRRLPAMALGAAFYAVGVSLVSVMGAFSGFVLCAVIYTIGEIIVSPVATTFVADLAPADMRGRYMGLLSLTWGVSYGVGPVIGGAIYDAGLARQLWLIGGGMAAVSALGYLLLQRRTRVAREPASE